MDTSRSARVFIGLIIAFLVALAVGSLSAQSGTPITVPYPHFVDTNGATCANCTLTSYAAGTTTQAATYSDPNCSVQNTNPVTLDASGGALIFTCNASYKYVLKTAGGAQVWSIDNIPAGAGWNLTTVAGKVTYTAPSTLTIASGAVTPTGNIHAIDTAGGGATLTTISTTNVTSGFLLILYPNNPGANPVTVASGGNIAPASGNFVMNASTSYLELILVGSTWHEVARSSPVIPQPNTTCAGRITGTSGTAVPTADQLAVTTLYYTPYAGNGCYLYDGSATWNLVTFSETAVTVPGAANTVYDLFAYSNSGTLALETSAWTNDTTRATAIAVQNGVYVKSGATTRRYLGTFRTTSVVGQTEDSAVKRYVWNYANRVRRPVTRFESTSSWTYTTAAFRQANASASNQIEVVSGVAEATINLTLMGGGTQTAAAPGVSASVSIGEDSTTSPATNASIGTAMFLTGSNTSMVASLATLVPVGRHTYTWLEYSIATGTATWFGNSGVAFIKNGLTGTWES